MMVRMTPGAVDFAAFTEEKYRELLELAARCWKFVSFAEVHAEGRLCLWRHDIDVSPQRALRLAQIEHEAGVRSTFFVLLHSRFYNAMELEIGKVLEGILVLDHDIALHFDPAFYTGLGRALNLAEALAIERHLLERMLGCEIRAFSFHNADLEKWGSVDDEEIAGMVNAYGKSIRERYSYVSDSNGYWRYRNLRDVLQSGIDERLHVLTHPEWWTPYPMSPRERIVRSVDGRAKNSLARYDATLETMGRKNVR